MQQSQVLGRAARHDREQRAKPLGCSIPRQQGAARSAAVRHAGAVAQCRSSVQLVRLIPSQCISGWRGVLQDIPRGTQENMKPTTRNAVVGAQVHVQQAHVSGCSAQCLETAGPTTRLQHSLAARAARSAAVRHAGAAAKCRNSVQLVRMRTSPCISGWCGVLRTSQWAHRRT